MKRSSLSEEQVSKALRKVKAGVPVVDLCRKLGISEATFYVWEKKYGELSTSELHKPRQLEEENAGLKRLLADLTLDKSDAAGPVVPKAPHFGASYFFDR